MLSVCSASDTFICLLCAEFPSLLLLYACCVFGVCNRPRRCFSFSNLLEAAGCMHLHSSRMIACCVRNRPFPVRACAVWLHDMCAVRLHDLRAVWLYLGLYLSIHDSCAACSYTTRVRCVRDEDKSRRFESCTGHQVGLCPALKSKEHRQFRSHDSNALILDRTGSTNTLHPKLVRKRCPIFTQCNPVCTNYDKPVGQPYANMAWWLAASPSAVASRRRGGIVRHSEGGGGDNGMISLWECEKCAQSGARGAER